MRLQIIAASAAVLSVVACKTDTAFTPIPTQHLTATITESNNCQVSLDATNFSSIGQVRGDVPKAFIGTIKDESYHGFGCWVSKDGITAASGDGDLIVIFSGNNLGKPLDPGTYVLSREILDNTPLGHANVSFRTADLGGDKLTTLDNATGSVVVEETPDGGRTVKVDVMVTRWRNTF